MIARVTFVLALVVAFPVCAAAQPAVFLVRHAERADASRGAPPPMTPGAPPADPDLSDVGRARASSLAEALKDANIKVIYATEFKRTQQTAAPLAEALGLTVMVVPAHSVAALVTKLKAGRRNALVVGHSDTVPDVLTALGVRPRIQIPDTEFDNLFVVIRSTTPAFVRLHYR
jgi:phosphohistidine phosphatase SixA